MADAYANALYGSVNYGNAYYGNVNSARPFRYSCGEEVTSDRYFRYQAYQGVNSLRPFRYKCTGNIMSDRFFRYHNAGWVISKRIFRYFCTAEITEDRPFRYTCLQGVNRFPLFRYSNNKVQREIAFRYANPAQINNSIVFRYIAVTPTYMEVIGGNPSGNPESSGGGTLAVPYVNPLQGDLSANGMELGYFNDLGIKSFAVSFKESEPSKWAVYIMDTTGKYNPENQTTSWKDQMNDDISHHLRSRLTYAGQPFEYEGVPLGYSWEQDWKDRAFHFVWSGCDKSELLFRDGKTFETVRSKLDGLKKAQAIIRVILGSSGLDGTLDFQDFIVPTMHMQNSRPIEYIKALLECVGAEWRFEHDNTFHAYMPGTSLGTAWIYDLSTHFVQHVNIDVQFPEIVNQVVIARAREVGQSPPTKGGGQGDEVICIKFGQYTHEFEQPLNGLYFRVLEAHLGQFNNFRCYDKDENLVAIIDDTTGAFPQSLLGPTAYGVKKVIFTWHVQPGLLLLEGYAKIRFYGSTNNTFAGATPAQQPTLGFDQEFVVTATYQASVDKHGLRKVEISPNPLIPTKDIAKIYAQEYIRRSFRSRSTRKYKVPLNPLCRVGDTLMEKYPELGKDTKVYVSEVSHNFSNDPDQLFTLITAHEYPSDFNVTFT